MEFPIQKNNLHVQFMARMLRVYSGIGLLIALVLLALGHVDAVTVAVVVAVVLFVWTVVVWFWSGLGKGAIRIDHDGFTVQNKRAEHWSPWADVKDVSVATLQQTKGLNSLFMRAFLLDASRPFVLIKLRRMVRVNPLIERSSTRGLGIPLSTKEVMIYPEDVAGLAAAASHYAEGNGTRARESSWGKPFGLQREDQE
jgi:hypothetical protein